jgi:hypothetical protein
VGRKLAAQSAVVDNVNNVGDIAVDSIDAQALTSDGIRITLCEMEPEKTFNAVDISVDIICLDSGPDMS